MYHANNGDEVQWCYEYQISADSTFNESFGLQMDFICNLEMYLANSTLTSEYLIDTVANTSQLYYYGSKSNHTLCFDIDLSTVVESNYCTFFDNNTYCDTIYIADTCNSTNYGYKRIT